MVLSLASTTDRGSARNGSPVRDVALDLLKDLVKCLPMSWREQRRTLGFA